MFEPASTRFTVEVLAKKRRMLLGLFKMAMGDQSVTPPEDEIVVKDRATDEVVYREAIEEGPHVAAAVEAVRADLDALDIAAFCAKYAITGYPGAEGTAP